MSWYMFAVIGGAIGAVLVTKMRKKFIYVSQQKKAENNAKLSTAFLPYNSILVVSF